MVVSCFSSSFLPSGDRRDQATTKPREPLELLELLEAAGAAVEAALEVNGVPADLRHYHRL